MSWQYLLHRLHW